MINKKLREILKSFSNKIRNAENCYSKALNEGLQNQAMSQIEEYYKGSELSKNELEQSIAKGLERYDKCEQIGGDVLIHLIAKAIISARDNKRKNNG